jgi:ferritin-like metal-binding protein YciE
VTESSPPADEAGLGDLLIDELRDILYAEQQLTKALPKMREADHQSPRRLSLSAKATTVA